jgi:hypothetical protein
MPKLENAHAIPSLKMGLKLQLNSDLVMMAVFEESGLKQMLEVIAWARRMNWPITRIGQIETHKKTA